MAIAMQGCKSNQEKATPFISEISTKVEPMQSGKFKPTWESLRQYQTPEWYRDAKFGIWAHWGPQCAPEHGDWYARYMYMTKLPDWAKGFDEFHRQTYGHPSKFRVETGCGSASNARRFSPMTMLSLRP